MFQTEMLFYLSVRLGLGDGNVFDMLGNGKLLKFGLTEVKVGSDLLVAYPSEGGKTTLVA